MNRLSINLNRKNDNKNEKIAKSNESKNFEGFFEKILEFSEKNKNKVISDGTLVFSTNNDLQEEDDVKPLIIPCKNRLKPAVKEEDEKEDLPEDEIARQVVLDAQRHDDLFEYRAKKGPVKPILQAKSHTIADDHVDYSSIPVENFGLAMLMGMGYDPNKPTDTISSDYILNKRRVYDRAGLGSHDTLMKVAQLSEEKSLWLSKGLIVKVIDSTDEFYRYKGEVVSVEADGSTVYFEGGFKKAYKTKQLETVVKENEYAKVVLPVLDPTTSTQLLGKIVKVVKKSSSTATVELEGKKFQLGLDNICFCQFSVK